ncbi:MAG: DNA translocase FtsK 4TM domain-containing protein [Patescibacteria group bacterium]|nr:DNA translocase FtsK 4TM domain-containing protein [Patescibacteria group bacterium]
MKKRKKINGNRGEKHQKFHWHLTPETRRGIAIIALLATTLIIALSIFNLAGSFGVKINDFLRDAFGWDRILIPVIMAVIAYVIFAPGKLRVNATNWVGVVLFFLFFNALVHVLVFGNEDFTAEELATAGGMIGLLVASPFLGLTGFWGALVLTVALTGVSILFLLNTYIQHLMAAGTIVGRMFTAIFSIFKPIGFLFKRSERTAKFSDETESEIGAPEVINDQGEYDPGFAKKIIKNRIERIIKPPEEHLPSAAPTRVRAKIDIPFDLLSAEAGKPTAGDIKARQEIIRKTLADFGVQVEMGDIAIGPTVTQYTLKPTEGVKLTRITALTNDLALALAAHPIRIEAPIPGKSLVGIEVPNQSIATVRLRQILDTREFRGRKSNTYIALGKDVSGAPHLADIARMPHLLVAGSTGSGKTVCLNAIIMSLLFQNSPDELKFILIDPKRVELPVYNGLPHLLTPVVTDVHKTVNAFKWAIREMEKRFDILSKCGARDIGTYNSGHQEKLPYIIIVIDELADLMTAAASEVEASIIRLAQMARAVGIHLILATQRPSVDVITGLIKANFPARIAFAVASLMDSRTILDTSGAEKLLGRGDMLFTSAEISKPRRLQGAFVTDQEIRNVVSFIKEKYAPASYDETVTEKGTAGGTIFSSDGDGDPLMPEAVEAIFQAKKASASLLQRRLKVGYARAARLLDLMEEQGIIGPGDGAKPRELLINSLDDLEDLGGAPLDSEEVSEETAEDEPTKEQENNIATEQQNNGTTEQAEEEEAEEEEVEEEESEEKEVEEEAENEPGESEEDAEEDEAKEEPSAYVPSDDETGWGRKNDQD